MCRKIAHDVPPTHMDTFTHFFYYILVIGCITSQSAILTPHILTHLPLDQMDDISQTTFSHAFSWMKKFDFWLKYHWSLFLRVKLTITQHWFRWWFDAEEATSHYLNQSWPDSLTHICDTRGSWVIPWWVWTTADAKHANEILKTFTCPNWNAFWCNRWNYKSILWHRCTEFKYDPFTLQTDPVTLLNLHSGTSYTGKMASLYWISPQTCKLWPS